MRCALARVVVLISVALALANAECFTKCLAGPSDHGAPPCHSHAKAQTPGPQHDLRPVTGSTVQPAVFLTTMTPSVLVAPGWVALTLTDAELRPPPLAVTTTIPLRI